MGKQFFFFVLVNGCVQYPVAFSELMVSFRVTAHLQLSGTTIPEIFSVTVLFFQKLDMDVTINLIHSKFFLCMCQRGSFKHIQLLTQFGPE